MEQTTFGQAGTEYLPPCFPQISAKAPHPEAETPASVIAGDRAYPSLCAVCPAAAPLPVWRPGWQEQHPERGQAPRGMDSWMGLGHRVEVQGDVAQGPPLV
eukprot:CAMPEP_0202917482 /NCGR_PEP_ID=MMETSP1392-20130828/71088_1 /ASSEMBLY_ACC=CAM_ASM_000868 /TAXON_ID=225041 /ORGANISM="Chlamydomonas chlamydogama, Strain SAG 11-48b" /LENGTH=100 /DNA_ID=CAMNT_0049610245 /DNA_START=557 /DNA_END=860 /DNA_ORIENTATION=+